MKPSRKQTSRERIEQHIRRSARSAQYICPAPSRSGNLVVFGQFLDQLRQFFVMVLGPGSVTAEWHRFDDADDAFEAYVRLSGGGLCLDPSGRAEREFRDHVGLG